jgi:hypothetical protein
MIIVVANGAVKNACYEAMKRYTRRGDVQEDEDLISQRRSKSTVSLDILKNIVAIRLPLWPAVRWLLEKQVELEQVLELARLHH